MRFHHLTAPDVEAVVNTEQRDESGDTPLLQCVREYLRQTALMACNPDFEEDFDLSDHLIEMLDILVHKRANVNAQDRHFKTALILLASSPFSLKVIRYLVEAGASTLYISGGGYDCIDEAIYHGNMETARYLKEARSLECRKREAEAVTVSEQGKKKWTTFWKFF